MSSIFETIKLSKSDDPFIIPKNILDLDSFEFDGLEGKTNLREMLDSSYTDAVSYTHLTLPTNREV